MSKEHNKEGRSIARGHGEVGELSVAEQLPDSARVVPLAIIPNIELVFLALMFILGGH